MVVDTNIVIEHLRATNKFSTTLYLIPENTDLFISSVSMYELYMGAINQAGENELKVVMENIEVLNFTDDVAYKAAKLYNNLKKQNKLIEFRDIFIAATCIVNNLPLLTLNKKHFNRFEELALL